MKLRGAGRRLWEATVRAVEGGREEPAMGFRFEGERQPCFGGGKRLRGATVRWWVAVVVTARVSNNLYSFISIRSFE